MVSPMLWKRPLLMDLADLTEVESSQLIADIRSRLLELDVSGTGRGDMKAPTLLDHIEALTQAFDEAWESIASTIDPASVENARRSLADAIVAHADLLGTADLSALKAEALASFSFDHGRDSRFQPAKGYASTIWFRKA